MANILLGVTGSIAAYKACELTRLLVKDGHDVQVLMTDAATKFIAPLTFRTLSRNPVTEDMFAEPDQWVPGHVALADRAELFVIAPCTANVMAKLAHGLADDLLTSTALATRVPILLAPAMNTQMWEHPATQANVKTLLDRGVRFVDADTGDLACGVSGKGRMAEAAEIAAAIRQMV